MKPDLFFKMLTTDASGNTDVQFTRDGAFYLSPSTEGTNQFDLVASSGAQVLDQWNEPISLVGDVNSISITEKGTLVAVTSNGQEQAFELGVISVKNPQYLESKDGNIFGISNNANAEIVPGDIYIDLIGGLRESLSMKQGHLETLICRRK